MKTAIILHGMPDKNEYYNPASPAQSNKHWLPWIQRQLILKDVLAQTPELPRPYAPNYKEWKKIFEQFAINEDTILIGHSCGAGFLVRWLSESNMRLQKVVLVAPWINPDKVDLNLVTDFFDFEMNAEAQERVKEIIIFISDNDKQEIITSAKLINQQWPKSRLITLSGQGHFTKNDMGTEEFPELIDELNK